jgi:hypothetical protein
MITGQRPGQDGFGNPSSITVELGKILRPIHVIAHRETPRGASNAGHKQVGGCLAVDLAARQTIDSQPDT